MQEKKLTRAKIVIEALRKHYGDSVGEFAKRLGVAASTVSTWANRDSLDEDLIFRKCNGVSYNYLLSGIGNMFDEPIALPYDEARQRDIKQTLMNRIGSLEAAEQKKPPEILFAEGLLPQLTPDDLNEVIGDMLGRIKKAKNRATDPLFDLLPDNKPLAIAKLQEQIRMLEDPEGELSQTPVAKPATER